MAIMRRERTEELKAKRRIYGDRGGHLHLPVGRAAFRSAMLKLVWHCSRLIGAFSEHKYVPRPDGISNAITTFDKDNYVLVTYGQPIKF